MLHPTLIYAPLCCAVLYCAVLFYLCPLDNILRLWFTNQRQFTSRRVTWGGGISRSQWMTQTGLHDDIRVIPVPYYPFRGSILYNMEAGKLHFSGLKKRSSQAHKSMGDITVPLSISVLQSWFYTPSAQF